MPIYFNKGLLLVFFVCLQGTLQNISFKGPPYYFGIDRTVPIFGEKHLSPSCFGTLLTPEHVITSASCLLRLSKRIILPNLSMWHDGLTLDNNDGLVKVEVYSNLKR